ncbi:lipid-A-disaccharide synthase, partial [Neisseria meningitidis]
MVDKKSPLIAVSAGEASGDLLGSHMIRAIRKRCPPGRSVGIGGEPTKAERLEG